MEGGSDKDLLKELAEYRNGLQNLLAAEAVKAGFLKDSVKSIPELAGLVRTFFEHCIREYHSLYDHVEPLAVLGSCCFAGAAAAHLWEAVEDELLKSNLFVLLSRERGMKYLDDTALELAGMPGGTPDGDRLAACIKGTGASWRWPLGAEPSRDARQRRPCCFFRQRRRCFSFSARPLFWPERRSSMMKDTAAALLRAGVDKLLKSDAVMGALRRHAGRYADILDLGCTGGGITLMVRPLGFSEDVCIVLSRAEVDENGAWIRPVEISADRESVDALLRDFVQGKKFPLPSMARPFAGMLKRLLSD